MDNKKRLNEVSSTSLDVREDLVKRLLSLVPEAETDGKIDWDKLKQELTGVIDESPERYNFTWNGKKQAMKLAQLPSTATLKPNKEKSKNWNTTGNLYIEGDNLEVLKLLQKSYANKIKLIYIDPPYNTGKDFVYKDNFKDTLANYLEQTGQVDSDGNKLSVNTDTSGRYHTDWLNMMYPRLKLARNLLTDDGVIFISIDENEVTQLRKICDEIFGENNFVGMLSVENNPKGRKNSLFISVSSDYCIIYAKNKDKSYFIENVPKKASDMTLDSQGVYVHNSGKRVLVGENKFNSVVNNEGSEKNYSVYYHSKDNRLVTKKEKYGVVDTRLIEEGYNKYFSYSNGKLVENTYTETKFIQLFSDNALEFSESKIYEKNIKDTIRIKSQLTNREYEAIVNGQKKKYSMDLTTTGAGTYIKELFNSSNLPFSAPKNIGFLKLLITLIDDKSFIALDFFSGSSTTADAVMRLNAEDGGNRKFIMVQLPEQLSEKDVAYADGYRTIPEIAQERIRRAGDKIVDENPLFASKLDIGFKVFELDKSNIKKWNIDSTNLIDQIEMLQDNFETGSTPLDVVYEIMLKQGHSLTSHIVEENLDDSVVFTVEYGAMFIVLGDKINSSVANYIVDKIKELEIENSIVVFQDQQFESDSEKLNAIEILNENGVEYDNILSI